MTNIWDSKSLRLIAAGIVVINGFFPAVWILLTSLKTEAELVSKPITYWPHNPTLANYVQAFTDQPLLKYLGNSVTVALSATIFSLLVSALAAYAIARLNLKRRQLILTCIVASSMFPLVTLLVPIFETMRTLGLLNSYTALGAALHRAQPAGVHAGAGELLPEHSEGPGERRDDRRLHAHGRAGRVVVPLAAPGVFTAGILAFVNSWDEFLLALSLNSNPNFRTLPVGITLYQGEFTFPWPIISAALIVAIVPIAVPIAIFQERVVGGPTQGGLEGLIQHGQDPLRHHRLRQHGPRAHREPPCDGRRGGHRRGRPARRQAATRPRRCSTAASSCSSDHQDLLASGLCDAVVVASPNHTHIDVMRDALATDLHILCEKPLVTRIADGVEMIDARRKAARASSGWRRNTATCRRWRR